MIKDMFFENMKGNYSSKVYDLMADMKYRIPSGKEDHYDYTSRRYKRRREATVNGIGKIKEELSGICENSIIEAYFAYGNSLIMAGGYNDNIDSQNYTTLGAAIWILDQLSLQGDLEKCFPFLPDESKEFSAKSLLIAPFAHPVYDFSLVHAMVRLIRQRNTAQPSENVYYGELYWDKRVADGDEVAQANRTAFDSVIELLDKQAIGRAVAEYEKKVWEFYRLSFSAFSYIEKRIEQLEKEKKSVNTVGQKKVIAFPMVASPNNELDLDSPYRQRFLADLEIKKLSDLTLTELSLINDREKTVKRLRSVIPQELADELIQFHVGDPYESAFALLYLLDTDSDIPWYYYGSISVAYTMRDQFPYDAHLQMIDNPVSLSEWNKALYEHKYKGYRWTDRTDASKERVQRETASSLSQLIYSNSMALVPRVIPKVSSTDTFLEALGNDLSENERTAYSLLLYTLEAKWLHLDDYNAYRLANKLLQDIEDKTDSENKESATEELSADVKAIQEENIRLREKNTQLILSLQETISQKRIQANEFDLIKKTFDQQNKEVADLREKVFLFEQTSDVEDKADESIKYPFYVKKKLISFGGQASWINEMKKKLPNVTFISPDTLPNVDLIRGADEIWIQTKCISHSAYYKIMDTIRSLGTQVRYFVNSGVNRCAEQVVRANE